MNKNKKREREKLDFIKIKKVCINEHYQDCEKLWKKQECGMNIGRQKQSKEI